MSKYTASISIVTHNSEKFIGNLLDSLHTHLKDASLQIYVVDNASTDNTLEIITERNYGINIIRNEHNLGFGAGHNTVIKQIDSKYHFCINPDIVIDTDVISAMAT